MLEVLYRLSNCTRIVTFLSDKIVNKIFMFRLPLKIGRIVNGADVTPPVEAILYNRLVSATGISSRAAGWKDLREHSLEKLYNTVYMNR